MRRHPHARHLAEEDGDDMAMPIETLPEDCGWSAGPIERERPTFTGLAPGPTDESITHKSTEEELMATRDWKVKCMRYTMSHVKAYSHRRA